jgi:hypothetical protein
MFELFVIGTFWFWALCLVELVVLLCCVAQEHGVGATVSLLVFGALLQLCGDANIVGYVVHHPHWILVGAGGYFLIGVAWAFIKWRWLIYDQKTAYLEKRTTWLRQQGSATPQTLTDEYKNAWIREVANSWPKIESQTPIVTESKARIMRWMSFWPVSMSWALIDDFVLRIFTTIYNRIHGRLQAMADAAFASVRSDLTPTAVVAEKSEE